MSKFVIGDRTKDEWISVLDTEKKKLEFTNHLASAKEYLLEEDAQMNLQKIQETGYFSDLQIYMKEDNKAYKIGNLRIVHAKANQPPANGRKEEMEDLHLTLHLAELISIGLTKRFPLHNGTLGIGCGLKGIVEALACQLIGEPTGIANKYHMV